MNDEGKFESIEKIRGRHKSLKRLIKIVGERGASLQKQYIGVVHGDDAPTKDLIKVQLKEAYGCNNFLENYVGCAIGAHTGPGIIGITFLDGTSPYEKYLL